MIYENAFGAGLYNPRGFRLRAGYGNERFLRYRWDIE